MNVRLAAAALMLAAAMPVAAFDLQGHRGTRGLEPENTLAAFRRALEIGVDTLEMDAAITADGVVVVSHDPELPAAITRDAHGRWLQGRGPLISSLDLRRPADLRRRPHRPRERLCAPVPGADTA